MLPQFQLVKLRQRVLLFSNTPNKPPASAKGTVNIITNGSIIELYCTAITIEIPKKADVPLKFGCILQLSFVSLAELGKILTPSGNFKSASTEFVWASAAQVAPTIAKFPAIKENLPLVNALNFCTIVCPDSIVATSP
jgi:hypothetical protein